jgi:release factor glutamine methyltransferase
VKLRAALRDAEQRLAAAGIDTPRVDAELLLAHVMHTTRSGLYADTDREVDGAGSRCSRAAKPASRSRTCSANGAFAG